MHEEETDWVFCDECGEEFSRSSGQGLHYAEDGYLCYACAIRRGATYDPVHEAWQLLPDLTGLPDARLVLP